MTTSPAGFLNFLATFPTIEVINEAIVYKLMCSINSDYGVLMFCDILEDLCDEIASKNFVVRLKNGM